MYSLPAELWILIASNPSLSKSDLAHLCATSLHLLHIVRPLLYHTVKVEAIDHKSNASKPLSLLAQDKVLAKCVIELTVSRHITTAYHIHDGLQSLPGVINLDALANMTSLKSITLRGNVFRNAREQHEFGRVLAAGSGIPLKELTYHADSFSGHRPFPSHQFGGIGSLTTIVWNRLNSVSHIEDLRLLWEILSRSRTTIRTLSLPFNVRSQDAYLRLWSMRFPHLRSLTLGSWGSHLSVPPGADNLTDFILAHSDNIEELHMAYGVYPINALRFNDSSLGGLREDSFPHLRVFAGCASAFMAMVEARMSSLRTTLRQLVVGPSGKDDETLEMKQMFNAMVSLANDSSGHCFSALRDIELDISLWGDDKLIPTIECIQQCARCCGSSLEVLRLRLPLMGISADSLGELFGLFERLKVIYLDEGTFVGRKPIGHRSHPGTEEYSHNNGVIETYVRMIASSCRALNDVFVKRTGSLELWTIARAPKPTTLTGGLVCGVSRRIMEEY